MGTFLASLAALAIAVLLVALGLPHVVDWNSYRPAFEREAAAALGLPVSVGGTAQLTLLPQPRLRFSKLRVGGADAPPLVEAEEIAMAVAVLPLFEGILEASGVVVDRPIVRLTLDETGRPALPPASSRSGTKLRLADLRFTGGRVELSRGAAQLAFAGLDGTLLQEGLGFRLAAQTKEFPGEARLSAAPEADGWRLRGGWTGPERGRAQIDGMLQRPESAPSFQGTIDLDVAGAGERSRLTVRAMVSLNAEEARAQDIALTVTDTAGRAQTLSGRAALGLGPKGVLSVDGTTQLFDFDRAFGLRGGPAEALANLARAGNALPGNVVAGRLSLSVRQAVFAGATLDDVKLEATPGASGGWRVETLRGRLGESEIALSGRLLEESGAFDGGATASGRDMAGLARWLRLPLPDVQVQGVGFSAALRLAVSHNGDWRVAVTEGRLGRSRFAGRIEAAGGAIESDIEAARLDLVELQPGGLLAAMNEAPGPDVLARALGTRGALRLRAGEVLLSNGLWHDVTLDAQAADDGLRIADLSGTRDDLSLQLAGEWPSAEPGAGAGRLSASAQSAAALGELTKLLPQMAMLLPAEDTFESLVPARLAARWSGASGVTIDGTLGARQITLAQRGAGAETSLDMTLRTLPGATAAALPLPLPAGLTIAAETARLQFDGAPNTEGELALTMSGPEGTSRFTGRGTPFGDAPAARGRLELESAALARLLGLPAGQLPSGPASADVTLDGETLAITDLRAGAVTGRLEISQRDETIPALSGALTADRVTLGALAQLLETPGDGDTRELALSRVGCCSGSIDITPAMLVLGPGAELRNAAVQLRFGVAGITAELLRGQLFGGEATGEMSASKARSGVTTRGALKLVGAQLGALPQGEAGSLAEGRVDFDLTFDSEGPNWRTLAAAAGGRGTLRLGYGQLRGVSPGALRLALAPQLPGPRAATGAMPNSAVFDAAAVGLALRMGDLPFRPVQVPVTLAGGMLTASADLTGAAGTASIRAALDLAAATLDATVTVSAGEPGLPPVALQFAGSAADYGRIPGRLALDDLARALTVRRLEHDVETLEQLGRELPAEATAAPPRGIATVPVRPPATGWEVQGEAPRPGRGGGE